MGRKIIVAVEDPTERKRLRAALGPLHALKVIASTARRYRYEYAVRCFLWFCVAYFGKLADELEELDVQCSVFIHVCWEEGESRSLVADVLSGLTRGLQRKRILPGSWNWLNVWERHEMRNRATPLTCTQVLALSGILWHFGLVEMAWILPVAFAAMLRTGEMLEMRGAHVSFHGSKASIMLMGKTGVRTGHSESVVVDDPVAVQLLLFLTRGEAPMDKLYSLHSKWFRRQWKWAVCQLKLPSKEYQPYGLRWGGACEDWGHFQDAGSLVLLGRWGSLKAAKIYAVEALRIRDASQLSHEQSALSEF